MYRPFELKVNRNLPYFFDDFGGANYDNITWNIGGTAGGTVVKFVALAGQVRVTVPATATNEYYIQQDTGQNFTLSYGIDVTWRAKIENTANFAAYFGMRTDANNGIAVYADSAINGFWNGRSISGGNISTVPSAVAVDTNFHLFRCVGDGTSVSYFIDSTLIGSTSTNLPTGGMGPFARGLRNAGGAGTRTFVLDYVEATLSGRA